MKPHGLLLSALLLSVVGVARAEDVHVAVAANFASVIQRIAPEFERASGHRLVVSFGGSGKLHAQIVNGAPFDVLLSADDQYPQKLENARLALPGTRFTYAIGRLVLWSPAAGTVDDRGEVLRTGDFRHLAIANAKTAPYGVAAEQTMRELGAWDRLAPRLVRGENIAQTLQFIHSGNAELGFVALSQVRSLPPSQRGSHWLVPADLYQPLRQDAVLLTHAADKPAAQAFLDYLRSPRVRTIIQELGYELP